jgi:hypothetical protein
MREVGAFEAKNKLGTLLDWVENGEEVICSSRDLIGHLPGLTGRGCQTDSIVQ